MRCAGYLTFGLAVACGCMLLACGGSGGGAGSEPPGLHIATQPVPASVAEGQTATFTVTAGGAGPLGYQWCRNGTPIGGARFTGYTTPMTNLADGGTLFSVVITDASGASITSATATLTVSAAVLPSQHFVDPVSGMASGDGSSANPWRSLQDVIDHHVETRTWEGSLPYTEGKALVPVHGGAPVRAGDTIWLRSGDYGSLSIQSAYNTASITIAVETGGTARFSSVRVDSSQNWILRGFSVSPSYAATPSQDTLVTVDNHSWRGPAYDIAIEGFQLFSVPNELVWTTRTDWDTKAASAIAASGARVLVRDCQIRNVDFGISMSGKGSRVAYNSIDGFCGDGLRGLGDDEVFEYNLVKNRRDVNDNHPDGFQSWSVGPGGVGTGVVRNITLRGNVIIGYEDPGIPFAGTLQGIGCFDGTYEGWIVENNVVITDHWHGISFYGARNVRIVNNTVLDLNTVSPGPPWIMVTAHKTGTPSSACVVRNNLAPAVNVSGDGMESDHNLLVPTNHADYFVDPAHHDLRPAVGSPVIDQGGFSLAPTSDADERPRPKGAAVDVGAYEFAP